MVKHPDRQKYVRELNNAAKACGLQGIRDDVGRQAVLDFIQRVRQSAGPVVKMSFIQPSTPKTKFQLNF